VGVPELGAHSPQVACLPGDGFVQHAHEPGKIHQAFPVGGDPEIDSRELGGAQPFRVRPVALNQFRPGEQLRPAALRFIPIACQSTLGVDAHDDMDVVAHHRIGRNIDGEHAGELLHALYDPTAPVLEIAAGLAIEAAEIRASDTARYDVAPGGGVEGDEIGVERGRVMQDSFRGI